MVHGALGSEQACRRPINANQEGLGNAALRHVLSGIVVSGCEIVAWMPAHVNSLSF
jgi:hypothetical protein